MPGPKSRDTERVGGWLRPVSRRDAQTQKFEDALCKRLGLSPDEVVQGIRWTIQDGEDFGTVQPTLHLPADELREMWRAAAPPPPPTIADLLTSDVALAAFRQAWHTADYEGAKGDRVRQGMVAAIKAVS